MPKQSTSQETGDIGVAATQLIVQRDLRWIFREQPKDFGIDAQVEVVENGQPTGKLLALQIKAGPSFLAERTQDGYVFREDLDHLDYWTRHSLAVIVVLYDPSANKAWWAHVDPVNVEKTEKNFKLLVPFANTLDASAKPRLASIAEGPAPLQRLRALWMARPFMETIRSGGSVQLNVFVKTNTVTPRASIRVAIRAAGRLLPEKQIGPWYVLWPGADAGLDNLASLVPWASLERDEEEEAQLRELLLEDLYDQRHGQYFEGELMGHDQDYSEFVEQYEGKTYWELREETEEGEGYTGEFALSLSDLGKAFLVVDAHLSGLT